MKTITTIPVETVPAPAMGAGLLRCPACAAAVPLPHTVRAATLRCPTCAVRVRMRGGLAVRG